MEILLAIAAVVGLIWAFVLLARGGLLAGCLSVLVAGCCFGHPFFNAPLGPIPVTLDRVLWVGLLGACLLGRRWGIAQRRPAGAAEWVLGAFVAVLTASTLLHDWRWEDNQPLAHLVFFYLMPVGMYWVARQSTISPRGMRALLLTLALFGGYLALTAVAEVHQQWWAVFPKYVTRPELGEFFGRARGPLLSPIACGYYQSVGLTAAMLLWPRLVVRRKQGDGCLGHAGVAMPNEHERDSHAHDKRGHGTQLSSGAEDTVGQANRGTPRCNRVGPLALAGLLAVYALGLYSTLTRSVWIGAALAVAIVVGCTIPRRWRVPLLAGAILLGATVAVTQWERLLVYKRDQSLSAQASAESVKLRPILARVAWNMFLDRPLLGCGYGQYLREQVDYLSDRSSDLPLAKARPYVQHNVFLSLLAETGLVGTGLFAALLWLWMRDAWRLWRSEAASDEVRAVGLLFLAMMGSYLANAMFHDVSLIPQGNMLLFLLAGVAAALRQPTAVGCPAGVSQRVPLTPATHLRVTAPEQ